MLTFTLDIPARAVDVLVLCGGVAALLVLDALRVRVRVRVGVDALRVRVSPARGRR
ncbi:hypothetical protein [Halarchaeum acidiphilum]|uniref:hypothetical protein n=1 Tax=Halarchaeum acidiphilum TaxID=489138 RepID=UPI00037E2644|nr:hypothetical protein [Halarchaeum acidiphilum]